MTRWWHHEGVFSDANFEFYGRYWNNQFGWFYQVGMDHPKQATDRAECIRAIELAHAHQSRGLRGAQREQP